jgi:predicted RNase H-like nuclease (RuvC/YqgF family)
MEDRLLLLKYRSEADIVEQMEIELDHLKYDFRLLESTGESLTKSLDQLITAAANRQRAGLEIEPEQRGQIDGVRQRMARNEAELDKLRQRSQAIRERFEREIDRYRLLTQPEQAG